MSRWHPVEGSPATLHQRPAEGSPLPLPAGFQGIAELPSEDRQASPQIDRRALFAACKGARADILALACLMPGAITIGGRMSGIAEADLLM
jgi:hypothetical protein